MIKQPCWFGELGYKLNVFRCICERNACFSLVILIKICCQINKINKVFRGFVSLLLWKIALKLHLKKKKSFVSVSDFKYLVHKLMRD